jgi:RNA polymerase sigma-70 factor (ECF subfamily)
MNELNSILERVLVLRCQTGDRAALEELYLRYSRRVGYYLQRLIGREDIADVQQEVWLSVIRNIAKLKAPDAFGVWLYRIARTRAMDRIADREEFERLDEAHPEMNGVDQAEFSASDAAAIHHALDKLSAPHREVLMLRFLESLTYEQIAQVAGCSVGTVRSRLFHAKRALRARLEKNYGN